MTQSGSALLRGIQNGSLAKVDLLVRESLQNSLDAAASDKDVRVNFILGRAERSRLDKVFSGLEKALAQRIPGDSADFIAIRDSGTTGLTGPLREQDLSDVNDIGNLRKLIYEICKPQSGEGKGGSWGLGKTVYFRVGIGIVLYYSRIRVAGGYESRLAAAIVEDERAKDSLLRTAKKRKGRLDTGVAWWGVTEGNNTHPVTDGRSINATLRVFGLEPYTGDDTGTTVIIPYIDSAALCSDANPLGYGPFNSYTLEDFINLAVQRWYAPRLYNKEYAGSSLRYERGGSILRPAERATFFTAIQSLYNASKGAETAEINIRNELKSTLAGTLTYRIFMKKELGMLAPNNECSPLALLNVAASDNVDGNPPIVAYARKAGMVISYETVGAWTDHVAKTSEDRFLVAFFVLNSENRLKDNEDITLDEYIRRSERSDHMGWEDISIKGRRYRIAEKIKKQVAKKLAAVAKPAETPKPKYSESSLQRRMGAAFLPPAGFGKLSSKKPNKVTPDGKGGTPAQQSSIGIRNLAVTYLAANECRLSWQVRLKKKRAEVVQELAAITNSSAIHALDWEDAKKGIGRAFPFAISKAKVTAGDESLAVTLKKTGQGVPYAIVADTAAQRLTKGQLELDCECIISVSDPRLRFSLSVRED